MQKQYNPVRGTQTQEQLGQDSIPSLNQRGLADSPWEMGRQGRRQQGEHQGPGISGPHAWNLLREPWEWGREGGHRGSQGLGHPRSVSGCLVISGVSDPCVPWGGSRRWLEQRGDWADSALVDSSRCLGGELCTPLSNFKRSPTVCLPFTGGPSCGLNPILGRESFPPAPLGTGTAHL